MNSWGTQPYVKRCPVCSEPLTTCGHMLTKAEWQAFADEWRRLWDLAPYLSALFLLALRILGNMTKRDA